jgi:hypothetical protein
MVADDILDAGCITLIRIEMRGDSMVSEQALQTSFEVLGGDRGNDGGRGASANTAASMSAIRTGNNTGTSSSRKQPTPSQRILNGIRDKPLVPTDLH